MIKPNIFLLRAGTASILQNESIFSLLISSANQTKDWEIDIYPSILTHPIHHSFTEIKSTIS